MTKTFAFYVGSQEIPDRSQWAATLSYHLGPSTYPLSNIFDNSDSTALHA